MTYTRSTSVFRFRTFVLVAIVAITSLVIIATVTLSLVGAGATSTPAITTITAVSVPVIIALMALLKVEQTDEKVNGHIARLTAVATTAAAAAGDPQLVQEAVQAAATAANPSGTQAQTGEHA